MATKRVSKPAPKKSAKACKGWTKAECIAAEKAGLCGKKK